MLFGGLGSADPNARDYLEAVYTEWGGGGAFDVFALHPYISTLYRYPDNQLMLDPRDYMHYESPTIIQKFLDRLTFWGDAGKELWATELGWNSAKGVPEAYNCPAIAEQLVYDTEQADYLTAGFDILLNEPVWSSPPNQPALTKVFWYSFNDTSATINCNPTQTASEVASPRAWSPSWNVDTNPLLSPQLDVVPWSFGLYNGNYWPKLSQCYYRNYPVRPTVCYEVYLPTLMLDAQ